MKNKRIENTLSFINQNDKVLDIGCVHHNPENYKRDDWVHKHIAGKCNNLLGVDIEKKGIDYLNAIGYQVEFCDIEDPKFSHSHQKMFDVINAGEIIEHLSRPGDFLEHCKVMLKDDGKLIISTPNVWNYYNMISATLRAKVTLHEQHTCWYDRKTISQLIQRHGYEMVFFKYLPGSNGYKRYLGYFIQYIGLKMLGGESMFLVLRKR